MDIVLDTMLKGVERAQGTVVIVDIFRATSLMATLFGLGAKEVYPTTELDEAIGKRDELTSQLREKVYLVGECKGITTDEFDIANTPITAYEKYSQGELEGKTIVGSSTNGYKGILSAKNADETISSSFLNSDATASYIQRRNPDLVTIIGMGEFGKPSDEDSMYCEFLSAQIQGKDYDHKKLREYLRSCKTAKFMLDYFGDWVQKDIDFCLDPNIKFDVVPILKDKRIVNGYSK